MLGIKKDWADEVLAIFIAVLYFNSLPKFSFIGGIFQDHPYIVAGIATVLLIFRKKIIDFLSK